MDDKVFTLELIDVYRSLPALWQVKSAAYSNKHIKSQQYDILLEKYNEKYPNAGKKELTLKINNLRTAFRKELKRMDLLQKSGAGVDEDLQSSLFYYDALYFLRDNELPCSTQSSLDENNDSMISQEGRKRKRTDCGDDLISLAAKRLQRNPDRADNFGVRVADDLRQMNETQRILAEKFIGEILFEGRMGTLHRNSQQLNIASHPTPSASPSSQFANSSHSTPAYVVNTESRMTRCSTPMEPVPVLLISPEIYNVEQNSLLESSSSNLNFNNALTRYFTSFQ